MSNLQYPYTFIPIESSSIHISIIAIVITIISITVFVPQIAEPYRWIVLIQSWPL